jgi:integrase/rubredoxin
MTTKLENNLVCPECGSNLLYRDGLRYLVDESTVQRWLCRNCGYRFSEKPLNNLSDNKAKRQICVILQDAKNLATATETKTVTGEIEKQQQDLKGKLVEFAFWMQKQGYRESTIRTRVSILEVLVRRGAILSNAETIKKTIALQKTWSNGTKANMVNAYSCFLKKEGLTWNPPRYKHQQKIPFIPTEAELNQLIGASGKVLSTFLQGLKETGADPGELAAITSKDVNKQAKTITLNNPVKGHRPRILTVSADLIKRLEAITNGSERIFNDFILRRAFYYKRKTAAHKLSNPRLRNITFITFRHWFATMEYHRTKDILHVQRLLGHKSIQNTLIYIDLEAKLFNESNEGFTSRVAHNVGEACSLIESGFEYVTGEYNDGGKIFRRRK